MTPRQRELAHLGDMLSWLSPGDANGVHAAALLLDNGSAYGLNPGAVGSVERRAVSHATAADTSWLRARIALPREPVHVVFSAADVARIGVDEFLMHWREMLVPARDDALVLSGGEAWALFYCHDDWFEFAFLPAPGTKEEPASVQLLHRVDDVWVVQLAGAEPSPQEVLECRRTRAVFRAESAGSVNARAVVSGKAILRLFPIGGADADLVVGDILSSRL